MDVELLKNHTKLSTDLTETTNKVVWLWEILEEISEEDKVKFVKFCWAQERLPSTHEEFEKLQIGFTIKSYLDKNRKDVYPRADTCFFSIELPEYTSKDVMKKLILQAISLDNVTINGDKINNESNRNDYGYRQRDYIYNDESEGDL